MSNDCRVVGKASVLFEWCHKKKKTNSKIEHCDFLYFNIMIMTDNLLTWNDQMIGAVK